MFHNGLKKLFPFILKWLALQYTKKAEISDVRQSFTELKARSNRSHHLYPWAIAFLLVNAEWSLCLWLDMACVFWSKAFRKMSSYLSFLLYCKGLLLVKPFLTLLCALVFLHCCVKCLKIQVTFSCLICFGCVCISYHLAPFTPSIQTIQFLEYGRGQTFTGESQCFQKKEEKKNRDLPKMFCFSYL